MPAVKNVGEPCAGEPHARIEVAAGGNQRQSATPRGAGASRRPYHSPPDSVEFSDDPRRLLRWRHVLLVENSVQCTRWVWLQSVKQRVEICLWRAMFGDELKSLVVRSVGGDAGDEDLGDLGA
jgi:hypothetical protein